MQHLALVLSAALLAPPPAGASDHDRAPGTQAPPAASAVSSSADVPLLDWETLFARVAVTGAEFRADVKALEGKRVRFRGYAILEPVPAGGLFMTRLPHERLHPDDEETLPWDAIGLVWRKGVAAASVPRRPTVEGTLRLGNRRLGEETVILLLEDAVPWVPPSR